MFMIVSYPWPVASAHVELTGPHPPDADMIRPDAIGDSIDQRARNLEAMVCWSETERLRFSWYRLRMAMRDNHRGPRAREQQPRSH